MRRTATLPVPGRLVAWPSRRRLVVADEEFRTAAIVDPVTNRVLGTHEFPFRAYELFKVDLARDHAVIVAGARGAPLRFVRIRPGRREEIPLRSIWLGLESRRAGSADRLPPRAREGLEDTRAAVAHAEGLPVSAVRDVAVTPGVFRTTAMGCPRIYGLNALRAGYQIIVEAAGRTHDYRVSLEGGAPLFCQHGSPPSARNLLRAPPSAHHVTAAALATHPSGRAYIVTPEGLIAEVPPVRGVVRLRRLRGELPQVRPESHGHDANATWVGTAQLVYSASGPSALRIDLNSGQVRVIAGRACSVSPRVGLILVYGLRCRGLDGRAPSGGRRFRLFTEGLAVEELDRTQRYAYVRFDDGRAPVEPPPPRKILHVVDLLRGAVVGQVEVGFSTRVISE